MDYVLAVDPGDVESAFVFLERYTYHPVSFAKMENQAAVKEIKRFISENRASVHDEVAIEMIASYGMAVGKSVFETCIFIGRLSQILEDLGFRVRYIYRKDVKMNVCGQMKAKDSNVRVALIDRFAKFDFKSGKGTKKNPDWFYGFAKDIWAAYGVGVTYLDEINS